MGLFTPGKTIRIEGTIDRIGVVYVSDLSLDYGLTLEGDTTRYRASAYQLGAEWDLALAGPGDRVGFLVTEKRPYEVHAQFSASRPGRPTMKAVG